jgi:hypothetical protein
VTQFAAAQEWLSGQSLDWKVRRLPSLFRRRVLEGFLLYRPRYTGAALHEKLVEFVYEEDAKALKSGEALAIPPWLIGVLVNIAIKVLMKLYERWWQSRGSLTIPNTGGA